MTRCTGQVVEREGPLRKAKALLRRLRERDLYKYVDSVQVPVDILKMNMCVHLGHDGTVPHGGGFTNPLCTCALMLSCGAEFVSSEAVRLEACAEE